MNHTYGRESERHVLKALKKGIYGTRDELEEDLDAYVKDKGVSLYLQVVKEGFGEGGESLKGTRVSGWGGVL